MQRFLPTHLRKKLLITATNFTIITKPVKLNALPTVNELLTITAKLERVKICERNFLCHLYRNKFKDGWPRTVFYVECRIPNFSALILLNKMSLITISEFVMIHPSKTKYIHRH